MNHKILSGALLLAAAAFSSAAPAADDPAGAVAKAKAPVAQWQAPPAAPAPAKGKTIYVVTCTSQGIGCVRAANGAKEAGEKLGWTVRVIDGKGDPGTWNSAIQSAIAAGANGIIIDAVPPMLVGDGLARAAAAKIPVVSIFNPPPDAGSPVFAYVRPDHRAQGVLMAKWVAADSGGNANILVVEDKEFPELNERVAGFKAEIAQCGQCKIVGSIESTIGTMAQRLPGAVAAELMRKAKADYIVAPFDSNAFFVTEGVRQAGRSGKVKVAGYEGDPQAIQAIRAGTQAMTIANPAEWMGWQAIDEMNRAFGKAKPANIPVAFRLIDRSNAPATKGWLGDVDFRADYEKLWGQEVMADTPWALQVRGLKKSYGSAVALAGADFDLGPCEIHALLGENGAGKSTLIKVLAGLLRPDEGEIRVSGRDWPAVATPRDAASFGLRFVHQDLGLVDAMSVLDNMAIETGYVTRKGGLIDFPATGRAVSERLRALGSDIDPCRLVGDLSQAEKVITAIARALAGQARIIVLDEVTASLPAPEATRLHGVIRRTREQGVSVVFVTHRIEEIFGLCDRATVFADGCRVASAALDQVDHAQIVRWIVGRDVGHRVKPAVVMARAACVQVRGLLGRGLSSPLDFEVGRGEVLGITGLVGSGYEAAARWLAGVDKPEAGSFKLDGQVLPLGDAGALRVHGYQVISGERAASVFPGLTIRENIFALAKHGRAGSISAERRRCAELIRRFGIQPADCGELEIGMLSGGNQQKALFARALESTPRALLMIDPTAGVDIGARAELYDLLRRETARGMAVILASSDFEEIESLADRALVLANGSPVALLEGAALTQSRLVYEALRPVEAQSACAQAGDKEMSR